MIKTHPDECELCQCISKPRKMRCRCACHGECDQCGECVCCGCTCDDKPEGELVENKIVIRYSIPNKMDQAPYGAIYSVTDESNDTKMYIQLSEDKSCPQWEDLGLLFELVFGCMLNDERFMSKCLDLYKSGTHTKVDIQNLFREI